MPKLFRRSVTALGSLLAAVFVIPLLAEIGINYMSRWQWFREPDWLPVVDYASNPPLLRYGLVLIVGVAVGLGSARAFQQVSKARGERLRVLGDRMIAAVERLNEAVETGRVDAAGHKRIPFGVWAELAAVARRLEKLGIEPDEPDLDDPRSMALMAAHFTLVGKCLQDEDWLAAKNQLTVYNLQARGLSEDEIWAYSNRSVLKSLFARQS